MPDDYSISVEVPEALDPDDLRDFLATCGAAMIDHIKFERFDTAGEGTWPETMWPRIAEFIEDARDGVVRARTMEREHQTGVGTGRLRDSVHFRVEGSELAVVLGGPEIDYAERFHMGGTSEMQIDQQGLRRAYASQRAVREFIREHRLGWLFQRTTMSMNQPARPIVTRDGIESVVRAEARARWPELAESNR